MKVCLASSGGGHLRQLASLKELLSSVDHYFVVEKTAYSQSLERVHRCFFVPDVALANLKRSPKAWRNLLVNLGVSLRASWREKPDVILSAGAGAALPSLLLGWLLGKRTVFLETLAHVRTPSVTGRIAARFVAVHLVQWEPLANLFPDAVVVCPLVSAKESLPPLSGAIRKTLVTVGTHAPFDRLVREVERLVEKGHIEGTVTAQGRISSAFDGNIRGMRPGRDAESARRFGFGHHPRRDRLHPCGLGSGLPGPGRGPERGRRRTLRRSPAGNP